MLSGSYSHLHSFFMRLEALLLMVFGKSTWSMPRIVAVRIFRGSEWLNGSLERKTGGRQDNFNLQFGKICWKKRRVVQKFEKLTYHSEVQTQKHPATTSLHTCCGLCSRWFQVPCSPAYHKTSTFSYPPQPSLDTWSQPARDRYEYICSHLCYISFNKTWR